MCCHPFDQMRDHFAVTSHALVWMGWPGRWVVWEGLIKIHETKFAITGFGGVRAGSTMPKFYCDYCDTYLTHDSPSVRKTHCSGRKHKENVKDYYQKWMEEQAQSLIDKTSKTNPFVILVCFAFASVFKCFLSFFSVLIQHNFPGCMKHNWECDLESEFIPTWSSCDT